MAEALQTVCDLPRGIHPPALADNRIVPAYALSTSALRGWPIAWRR